MPSLFEDLDELGQSLKGAYNATRLRMADPENRRALEEKMLREREQEGGRKRIFQGMDDATRTRDASEGLDPREALDPNAATERRMREAEEPLASSQEELHMKQQQVREIVARYQQGENISPEEKRLVFRVVTDAVKGMSSHRENVLADKFGELVA